MADLHVVAFQVPWPPNYGGVIDVYYRLRALAQLGLRIDLHCFAYDREPAPELDQLANVHYYPRKPAWMGLLSSEPYIVSSRASVALLDRLLADQAPILFDGLHSCHYLADAQLASRRKVVRMHNVEWKYYRGLAEVTRAPFREWYFREEARRLKNYEAILEHADGVACIAPADTLYYREQLGNKAGYLPAFHPFDRVCGQPGSGDFALYHGNLSVPENVQAATFLARWWPEDGLPLVLAGMDPDWKLVEQIRDRTNIRLVADPDEPAMERLVLDAHVHVLPTFQPTGIKLKLLRSLFQGRHVIANPAMVDQTDLAPFCRIAEGEEAWLEALAAVSKEAFTEKDLASRRALELRYNNANNAGLLTKSLFVPRPQ